jgi:hypothetical protein
MRDPMPELTISYNPPFLIVNSVVRGRIQRKTWCMGPFAGVDYNLPFCLLQSRLQHIYHGQPYARVDDYEISHSMTNFNLGSHGGRLCKPSHMTA